MQKRRKKQETSGDKEELTTLTVFSERDCMHGAFRYSLRMKNQVSFQSIYESNNLRLFYANLKNQVSFSSKICIALNAVFQSGLLS